MERRTVLRAAAIGAGTAAFSGALWQEAFAAVAQPGPSPYGDLLAADGNGIHLPAGFTSRVIAWSGRRVCGTSYTWRWAPDGGACFAAAGGGWIYVSNSEIPLAGGASAVRFNPDGGIAAAYRILGGTNVNCAGGATPWGTWLSCEEVPLGRVFETWPEGGRGGEERTRMGRFKHEAAACDPDRRVVYLTEDEGDGCFYRFVPDTWGDLRTGRVQVLCAPAGQITGPVTWADIPDRDGFPVATRQQVAAAQHFDGGEGCWYDAGVCYFTTKGDNRVWAYDAVGQRLDLAYDDSLVTSGAPPLTGVDNITGAASGDLFVAEDGGNMEINVITPQGVVAPFLRILGQGSSEITGPGSRPTAPGSTSPRSAARRGRRPAAAASRTRSAARSAAKAGQALGRDGDRGRARADQRDRPDHVEVDPRRAQHALADHVVDEQGAPATSTGTSISPAPCTEDIRNDQVVSRAGRALLEARRRPRTASPSRG